MTYIYFMISYIYFILILLWNLMRHRCFGAEVIYCWLNILKHKCYGAEVNPILDWLDHDRYMYCQKLSAILGPDLNKECEGFTENLKKVDTWRLWKDSIATIAAIVTKSDHWNQVLKSSVQNTLVWWVINLSSISCLTHRRHSWHMDQTSQ